MKAHGYIVLTYGDDPTVVSTDIEIDTDRLFVYIRTGDICENTPHPDHRACIERILENVIHCLPDEAPPWDGA